MKYLLLGVILFFFLLPHVQSGDTQSGEDENLTLLFKSFLEEEFKARPTNATRAGDHRFDHLLDDVSPKARAANTARLQAALDELPKRIDYKKMTRNGQIDFEIFEHYLREKLWLADNTNPFANDPRVYNGLITGSTYTLLTQSTLPQAHNVKNCTARMKLIPHVVEAAKESLTNPPKVYVETAINQNRGAIAYYESGIFEFAGETPALSTLREASKPVIASLRDYQKFLQQDLLPRANGEWRIGKEKFAKKLEMELDAGLSADEVLKEAEAEADRVENEMHVIARQMWGQIFPGRVIPADTPEGKGKTITLVFAEINKQHGKAEDLVKDAQVIADKVKTFITKKDILRLPVPDRCKIFEMPEFQRGNSIAFLQPAPPLDPKASSHYAISPPPREWNDARKNTYLEEYNRHMLQLLTIHEAYPGHYVQLEYANRCPSLIRKVLYSGVFAEGWAVYTEQVLLDQGYGDGDLALRLSQLKWYLRAVCNAILDHKMHCTNMTDQEALLFLMLRAYQSEAEALLKIIRAKQSSCQLSTYFVGRMAFQRLRRRFQEEMGDSFDLGGFHEACLDHGTLPVKYLPELVAEWLKRPR
ncbi:MAG: DUF885 domain-containing protein [Planctomycetes bacterium]|nr:DUF885 domain-containing protein [Planctomycetota bacterium]